MCTPGAANAREPVALPLAGPVPYEGVAIPLDEEPEAPFDFARASARAKGWWVPSAFVLDAGVCFTGCNSRVEAERARGVESVKACEDEKAETLAVKDRQCAERVAEVADPGGYPWGTAIAWGIGGVGIGAAVAAGIALAVH